jgi:aldose 1-epimerase
MTLQSIVLTNDTGMELRCIPLGGIIVSLLVPDRDGQLTDVVLGYDDAADYVHDGWFAGAIIGRYANRIANGRFLLDDHEVQVTVSDGKNHLHGGRLGFHKATWSHELVETERGSAIRFRHTSPDGDEGYPGTLRVTVTYRLTADNELIVDYEATTNRATPVNITQHTYFNLAGQGRGTILDHRVAINASRFTPVDSTLIPTGELRAVEGTVFDFTTGRDIGSCIGIDDDQLRIGGGYDHNFVIDRGGAEPDDVVFAARLVEPASGRTMELWTTEPGVQLYTGNGFDERFVGKGGCTYGRYGGIALEPQHFPDSPNQPSFPSTILRPGEVYRSRSVYRFGIG